MERTMRAIIDSDVLIDYLQGLDQGPRKALQELAHPGIGRGQERILGRGIAQTG